MKSSANIELRYVIPEWDAIDKAVHDITRWMFTGPSPILELAMLADEKGLLKVVRILQLFFPDLRIDVDQFNSYLYPRIRVRRA